MIKRVIAAVLALSLAGLGVFLTFQYGRTADQRALSDQEATPVLVATERIVAGTAAEDLGTSVAVQQVPAAYVMSDAVTSVADLEGLVAAREILPEQQVAAELFVTPTQLRALADFELPDEAELLHQLTINISNPQALGGSIAAGDLVGVFGTFSGAGDDEDDAPIFTDLIMDKVLVVRVEGGYVSDIGAEEDGSAQDVLNITLALEPQDAARMIFAQENASLWLTLSPQDAEPAQVVAVIPSQPTRTTGAIE